MRSCGIFERTNRKPCIHRAIIYGIFGKLNSGNGVFPPSLHFPYSVRFYLKLANSKEIFNLMAINLLEPTDHYHVSHISTRLSIPFGFIFPTHVFESYAWFPLPIPTAFNEHASFEER